MKFILEINCDNSAFDGPDLYPELARILRFVSARLDTGWTSSMLRDINGNTVGSCCLSEDDSD